MAHNMPAARFRNIIMTNHSTTALKDSRLHIRCDTRARALLDRAAAYTRVSVSEFVLKNALATAEAVVQEHEAITLAADDFRAFLAALDAPAKPNAAMKRALKRHAEQVR
jgi:uncharacterized protein (DUF1778 family)